MVSCSECFHQNVFRLRPFPDEIVKIAVKPFPFVVWVDPRRSRHKGFTVVYNLGCRETDLKENVEVETLGIIVDLAFTS